MKFEIWENELVVHDNFDRHTAYNSMFTLGLVMGAIIGAIAGIVLRAFI